VPAIPLFNDDAHKPAEPLSCPPQGDRERHQQQLEQVEDQKSQHRHRQLQRVVWSASPVAAAAAAASDPDVVVIAAPDPDNSDAAVPCDTPSRDVDLQTSASPLGSGPVSYRRRKKAPAAAAPSSAAASLNVASALSPLSDLSSLPTPNVQPKKVAAPVRVKKRLRRVDEDEVRHRVACMARSPLSLLVDVVPA
jgi:hypothetical protein